jgi:branched-chain amino acid transport system permease protein
MIFQFLISGWVQACVYFVVGLGFAMIYGPTRVFHFAHGAICLAAAYLFYDLYRILNWPLSVAAICAITGSALLGILTERLIHRPLIKSGASQLVHLLSSIGLSILLINALVMIHGNGTKIPSPGLQAEMSIGTVSITAPQGALSISAFIIFLTFMVCIRKTRVGRIIRAFQDDPELFSTLGYDSDHMRLFLFAVGSAIAAIGVIFYTLDVGFDSSTGVYLMLNGAVAVIVGGIARIEAVALGALLLGIIQSMAVRTMSAGWEDAVTFSVLIIFLVIRPQGLLGTARRLEEPQ